MWSQVVITVIFFLLHNVMGFDSRLKSHTKNSAGACCHSNSWFFDFDCICRFRGDIVYFKRALLLNGLRKFYKNNFIFTKNHLGPFQNANIYFNNMFLYVIFSPTNIDSFALWKKCDFLVWFLYGWKWNFVKALWYLSSLVVIDQTMPHSNLPKSLGLGAL